MADVLPEKHFSTSIRNIDIQSSTSSVCQAEVTIYGDLLPYHHPVTVHRSFIVGDLLYSVLTFENENWRWPSTEGDIDLGPRDDLDQFKNICGGHIHFHPNGHSCDVEFESNVKGRHYSYILRVKDTDESDDYLYGGKLNPRYGGKSYG